MALRHCSLDEAFVDIVQTAKLHNVAPMGLADALVAAAENDQARDFDDAVVAAVGRAWGALLGRPGDNADCENARQSEPTMTVCESGRPPTLIGSKDRANPTCR